MTKLFTIFLALAAEFTITLLILILVLVIMRRVRRGEIVKLNFLFLEPDGTEERHEIIVFRKDAKKLLEAKLRLHVVLGKNPYTGQPTAPLKEVTIQRLKETGPYWWTRPSLKKYGPGARILTWSWEETIWPEKKQED